MALTSFTSTGPQNDSSLDYNIEVVFEDSADFSWGDTSGTLFSTATIDAIQAAFTSAANTLSQIILADVTDRDNFQGTGIDIDDIQITATLENIDGAFGTLGSAGPNFIRGSSDPDATLPITGSMTFDLADVDRLLGDNTWEDVILHEMIHVLGLGTIWDNLGLVDESDPSDIRYTGANGVHEWQYLFPTEYAGDADPTAGVPVESVDGDQPGEALNDGTVGGHWDQATFGDNDIMTGYLGAPGANPISNLTIASLEDLGYTTTYVATPCFLSGTRIAIAGGSVTVEQLQIGQKILTATGGETEVLWVGRRTVSGQLAPEAWQDVVEIAPGALGAGLPLETLRVTADHALLLDGMLVQAGALINGHDITWYAPEGPYTVYHIETARHDVILAEGTATETFVDYVTRRAFENYDTYVSLYGEGRPVPEMDIPRIVSARHLPESLADRFGRLRAA